MGGTSAAPTPQDIEQALKAIHEKPASPGMDGAVTVEVKSVKIGQPRKWHFDDGGGGTPDTDAWPVRVRYLIKTHYRSRTLVYDWDKPHLAFKNGLGEWQVGITTGASKDTMYDLPPDMPQQPAPTRQGAAGSLGPAR
jgi:hypothetical protein